ncbi:MAG: MFS transporter [Candidatus Coatesbacteria bacterium]|nr:MAG: MFS transporter [Candidatus Coatesbacteria bacterium]
MTEPEAEAAAIAAEGPPRKGRLWNLNFALLWQGQFVSALGDTAYSIALGFWVLAVTGSTALMGSIMAAAVLARVVLSPFAGVIVDRTDRKWMLVWMDAVRGVFIVAVAAAAFAGLLEVWMVFVAAVALGVCGAFFNPAVGSALPDIVPKAKLVKANSLFQLIWTGSGIPGFTIGGFLYVLLGAPLLFLVNGVSYLISAATELFIKVPAVKHARQDFKFFADTKAGLSFTWKVVPLRLMILLFSVLNFFAHMGVILLLPLFERTAYLGPGLYGVALGGIMGGMFVGYVLTSIINIEPSRRFLVFYVSALVGTAALVFYPVWLYLPLMLALGVVFGVFNAVLNALISAVLQMTIPQDMRGKVFGLLNTISGGLTPLAMVLGGVLAEFISIRVIIAASFLLTFLFFVPLGFWPSIRRYVNFDPDRDTLESIN